MSDKPRKSWHDKSERERYETFLTKICADKSYIAYWLNRWCTIYGRRLADVANELNTSEDIVVHVMMCGAPRTGYHTRDIMVVAGKFHLSPRHLAALVYLCKPELPPVAVKNGRNVQHEQNGYDPLHDKPDPNDDTGAVS